MKSLINLYATGHGAKIGAKLSTEFAKHLTVMH